MKKRLQSGPGLIIGLPTLGRPVPLDWAFAFKSLSTPINYNTIFQVIKGRPVDEARNNIAKFAVEQDAKYLFFLGDDVEVPGHTLKILIHRMEQDPELGVVGGVYVSKCDPPAPLVFRGNGQGSFWDWKVGEFFEVTGMGMDCTLIRVEALKELEFPYFKTVDDEQFIDGINNAEAWTEDLYFFNKLAKLEKKWKVYIDGSVICRHWDVYGDRPYELPQGSLPLRQMLASEKKMLIVGASSALETVDFQFDGSRTVIGNHDNDRVDYRVSYDLLPYEKQQFDKIVFLENPYDPRNLKKNLLIEEEFKRVAKPGVEPEWMC